MSHQDKDCRTATGTYAQELRGTIASLLSGVDWKDIRFRKDCQWTPFGLVAMALAWSWSESITLKDRFRQAHRFARTLGQRNAPQTTSIQAFMKLLVRWTASLIGCLTLLFQAVMEREFPREFRFAGFVILVADGSKLRLARTQSNERRYSPQTRGKKGKKRCKADRAKKRPKSAAARAQRAKDKKSDCPQMALTLLLHALLWLPWDWRIGASDVSEREHLRDMIPGMPADTLLVADCGFVGYDFWSELLAAKRSFVIRVGGNVRLLKKLGVVRESNGIVHLWPDKVAKRKQPPLTLRLVVVHDGRQSWYLVTSVLDPQRLSDAQVAKIYGFRWRIELFFRHFKQTYRREKLRSHKAEHAECEAHWSLTGLWTMLLHTQLEHKRAEQTVGGRHKLKPLSVAAVLRAFGQAMNEYRCVPEAGQSLAEQLRKALLDRYRRKDKTSRAHPRKKYEPATKPPQFRNATDTQRQLAKQVTANDDQKRLTA